MRLSKLFTPRFGALMLAVGMTLAVASFSTGCGHATLEPGGSYAPLPITNVDGTVTAPRADFELFVADQSFLLAKDAVSTVMTFERDNRALLWSVSPQIKHSLDKLRPQVLEAETRYAYARRVYLAQPGPENLNTLQGILTELQRLSTTAQAVLPQNRPAPKPKN